MSNIPGTSGYTSPNAFSRTRTLRRATSIPGGLRIMCCIGLGESEETLILSAIGGGADGVNSNYAGSDSPTGRHFVSSKTSLVSRRTTLFINGIPLSGVEEQIDTDPFDSRFDYRMEPATGRFELQSAHIADEFPTATNTGNGALTVSLSDTNAPSETWTLRATSVIRDAYGDAIPGNAVFNVVGSESGVINDGYGAPITVKSDGVPVDNGVLTITILYGSVAHDRGDRFTVIVESGVLSAGDELIARMIADQDVNDPEFFTDPNSLFLKHGEPSLANTLSLGANLAFDNGAWGVLALQAKPALPRRTSEVAQESDNPLTTDSEGFPSAGTTSDLDLFRFTIDGGYPDVDTVVNIFVIDSASGDETQIFPTKHTFFDPAITDADTDFINDAGRNFEYTVIEESQVEDEGNDGVLTLGSATFSAASAGFQDGNTVPSETDVGKSIRILPFDRFGAPVADAAGSPYVILSVGDGYGDNTVVTLTAFTASASVTDLQWELVDTADNSAKLLLTSDHWTQGTYGAGDGLRISYIDADDADFYDNTWSAAYDTLETVDCQIVVPLPDQAFSSIQQAGRVHVELMSTTANQRERVLMIGAQAGVTSDALLGRELIAVEDIGIIEGIQGDDPEEVLAGNIEDLQDFNLVTNYGGTFRTMYFYPDEIIRVVQGTRTTIHGFYLAAAAAGRLAGTANAAIPLTQKVIVGFTMTRDKLLKTTTQNDLGSAGVALVQPVTGGGVILHGKTTTASGAPEEEEVSIVFIRDAIAQTTRDVLRSFVGNPEDPTIASAIASKTVGVLSSYISKNYITEYRGLSVTRDAVDPRQWNVLFEVQPNYPVGWIFIDLGVGLS